MVHILYSVAKYPDTGLSTGFRGWPIAKWRLENRLQVLVGAFYPLQHLPPWESECLVVSWLDLGHPGDLTSEFRHKGKNCGGALNMPVRLLLM